MDPVTTIEARRNKHIDTNDAVANATQSITTENSGDINVTTVNVTNVTETVNNEELKANTAVVNETVNALV